MHTYMRAAHTRCMPTHVDPRRPVSRARDDDARGVSSVSSPLRSHLPLTLLLLHARTREKLFSTFARGVRRACTRRNAGTSELHARPARARVCGRAYAHARPAFDCILRIYSDQRGEYAQRALRGDVPFPRFLALPSLSPFLFQTTHTHTHSFPLFPRARKYACASAVAPPREPRKSRIPARCCASNTICSRRTIDLFPMTAPSRAVCT